MSYFGSKDYYAETTFGNVSNAETVTILGSGNITTSFVPITSALVYQTPTAAASLEILSSSANDTSAGTGARTVTVTGLNASWAEVSQTITMNGITAVAIPTALIRLTKIEVTTSGTYASMSGGSHTGTITVRGAGGGATWGTIDATNWPAGVSSIGCYTVPTGKSAYIVWKTINTDSSKVVDSRFFIRPHADIVAAPYTGIMKQMELEANLTSESVHLPRAPIGPFVGPCDMGYIAKTSSGSAVVTCEFQLLLTTP